jgi:hypothetical protein
MRTMSMWMKLTNRERRRYRVEAEKAISQWMAGRQREVEEGIGRLKVQLSRGG